MSADLLRPPVTLTPAEALHRSQLAPEILAEPAWSLPWPLSILTVSDAPETWTVYENLFYPCVRTGDNSSAEACLARLKQRFGETNERVMGLMAIFHEATAQKRDALENSVGQYKEVVAAEPVNMVSAALALRAEKAIRKRLVSLYRNLGKTSDAITELVALLDASPTDAEAWAELSDLYLVGGQYPQAIYSLEEVLLITPNAWNIHARLGEVLYIAALASAGDGIRGLARSVKSFCRSVELCDDYLRGFYGLKLVLRQGGTQLAKQTAAAADGDSRVPTAAVVEKLNELATAKLGEIVRRFATGEAGWQGYSEAEVISARELLGRDGQGAAR